MSLKKVDSVKEHQEHLFDVLKNFDDFCRSREIKYSLAYGTMLGAIRHKGFIPWDDDVDVFMHREEYEKLERCLGRARGFKNFRLWGIYDKENYFVGYVAKLFDTETRLVEHLKRDVEYGVYIDIFIVDEMPSSFLRERLFLTGYRYMARTMQIFSRRALLFERMKRWLKITPDFMCANRLVRFLFRIKGTGGGYAATTCLSGWNFERVLFRKEWMSSYVDVEFEGRSFPVFAGWDKLLTSHYGEYMMLPPCEERYTHTVDLYVKNRGD